MQPDNGQVKTGKAETEAGRREDRKGQNECEVMYSGKNEFSRKTNGNESLSPTTEAKQDHCSSSYRDHMARERTTASTDKHQSQPGQI